MQKHKNSIRKAIREKIKSFSLDELNDISRGLLSMLENNPLFINAQNILLFHSLIDEVNTHQFIEDWKSKKNIFLPVVKGENLEIRPYRNNSILEKGNFGILEPQSTRITDLSIIELAIIPGLAFDHKMNRLGRGKAFYDRLLPQLSCPKIGICFPFQYLDTILTEAHDIPMDIILH